MAIIVEEQKSRAGTVITAVLWAFVMAAAGVGIYFLFLKAPSLSEVKPPENFGSVQEIAAIRLDPDAVIKDETFNSLKKYVTIAIPEPKGRSNPFLAL